MQDTRIQVIFRIDTKYGPFQDALWFTQDEYAKVTQDDIDKMKQERLDKWLLAVSTPTPEPTKKEELARLQSELDFHALRVQELQAEKLAVK